MNVFDVMRKSFVNKDCHLLSSLTAYNLPMIARRNHPVLLPSVFASILLFQGLTVSEAYAYLDPGSGSVVIQMLVGALAGVGIALKIYWQKIKEKIVRT